MTRLGRAWSWAKRTTGYVLRFSGYCVPLKSTVLCAVILAAWLAAALPLSAGGPDVNPPFAELRARIICEFSGAAPRLWGETIPGVRTRLKTGDKVLALTLDACGGPHGSRADVALLAFLEKEKIPATLFVSARWIDKNTALLERLARNPLFEIANHGLKHRPASVTGRGVYGVTGTGSVAELVDEIEGNALKIGEVTGAHPRYYRSGTAYYDEIAIQVARKLRHEVIGFSILGDAGATYRKAQVVSAMLKARPGDIALLHMNHPEAETATGLIAAIPELQRRGFRFVKLSDYQLE